MPKPPQPYPTRAEKEGLGAYHGLTDEEQQEGFLYIILWAVEAEKHKWQPRLQHKPLQAARPARHAALLPWSQKQPW